MSIENYSLRKGVIFDMHDTLLRGRITHGIIDALIPRADVIEALTELREHEVKLAVVTTANEADTRTLLDAVGIIDFFDKNYIMADGSERDIPVSKTRLERQQGLFSKKIAVPYTVLEPVMIATKPSPEPVHYLLREWGLANAEVVLVGDDQYTDQQCAKSAGVAFRYIPPMYNGNASLLEFVRAEISY